MPSRLLELTDQLAVKVKQVDKYLQSNNLPEPSFDIHGPLDMEIQSADVEAARIAAIEASMELQDLLLGPTMLLRPVVCPLPTLLALRDSTEKLTIQCTPAVQCNKSTSHLQIRHRCKGAHARRHILPGPCQPLRHVRARLEKDLALCHVLSPRIRGTSERIRVSLCRFTCHSGEERGQRRPGGNV